MKSAGKTWKELEKGAIEISGLSLMYHLGAMRIIYSLIDKEQKGVTNSFILRLL